MPRDKQAGKKYLQDDSTKKLGSVDNVEPPPCIPDLAGVPTIDWRIYVDCRISRFESAIESIATLLGKNAHKKVAAVERLKGEWQRVQGEYQDQKRYTAFGMKALKLLEVLWDD